MGGSCWSGDGRSTFDSSPERRSRRNWPLTWTTTTLPGRSTSGISAGREVALLPFLLYGAGVQTPFLHRPLWEFLDGLPYEIVGTGTFHTETLHAAYPQWAHIPFEDKSVERTISPRERWAFAGDWLWNTTTRRQTWRSRRVCLRRTWTVARGTSWWWNPMIGIYAQTLVNLPTTTSPGVQNKGPL